MDIFYALAEPTRRNIIEILADEGQLSATQIYEKFQVSHPAISQHLKILREANLVTMEKHAQQRKYEINPNSFQELEQWANKMAHVWKARFDALDKLLEKEKSKLSH